MSWLYVKDKQKVVFFPQKLPRLVAEAGREARTHGAPRGGSKGSFASFLLAMQVSGERTDVEPTLMEAGGGHRAAESRRPGQKKKNRKKINK